MFLFSYLASNPYTWHCPAMNTCSASKDSCSGGSQWRNYINRHPWCTGVLFIYLPPSNKEKQLHSFHNSLGTCFSEWGEKLDWQSSTGAGYRGSGSRGMGALAPGEHPEADTILTTFLACTWQCPRGGCFLWTSPSLNTWETRCYGYRWHRLNFLLSKPGGNPRWV